MPDYEFPLLFSRVIGIVEDACQGINKDGLRFVEIDAVFAPVCRFLAWIPFEFHCAGV